jgi:outer membrane usher protein
MDWRPRLSWHLDQGEAVVDPPGQAGVDVYRDNRPVATTDESGTALVPNLRPYQDNPIRIGDADLPMDIAVGSLKVETSPGLGRGVRVRFGVERSHWVGFSIDAGPAGPVPAGTRLQEEATGRSFPVGFDGKAHVEGRPGLHIYQASWEDHQCEIVVAIPETAEVMPDLGSKTCRQP